MLEETCREVRRLWEESIAYSTEEKSIRSRGSWLPWKSRGSRCNWSYFIAISFFAVDLLSGPFPERCINFMSYAVRWEYWYLLFRLLTSTSRCFVTAFSQARKWRPKTKLNSSTFNSKLSSEGWGWIINPQTVAIVDRASASASPCNPGALLSLDFVALSSACFTTIGKELHVLSFMKILWHFVSLWTGEVPESM